MKKIIIALLTVALLITTLTATLATSTNAAFYTQTITSTSTLSQILNIVKQNDGQSCYDKMYYIFYNSQFAAAYNKTFPYPNEGSSYNYVIDNGTKYTLSGSSKGCYLYADYVSQYIYGISSHSNLCKTVKINTVAGTMTATQVKNAITTYAQAGEHIRIDFTHSIAFVAYTNDGFYYTSYLNDSSPKISVYYTTWSNFANECNKKNKIGMIYDIDRSTNTGDGNETGSVSVTLGYAGESNTITDSNAILHGTVTKSLSSTATEFGISIRKSGTSTWEKVYPHSPVQDYVGTGTVHLTYDIKNEVGFNLVHGTSYIYQFFAYIDGKDYYSPEATFTTTGSHSYGAWQTVASASCTAGGTQKRTCACGAVETATVSALGHSYSSTFTVDKSASCTVAGSKSKHCTRSGCTATTEVTAIPATGHSYGEWEYVQTATCTANGTKKRTCGSCGHIEYGTLLSGGHNYSSTFTVDKPATCTTQGSKSKHCAWCTSKIEVTAIPATGHTYGAWQTVTKPSCTATGSQKHVCSSCSHTEYKTVAALGHDYSSAWTTDKAATCTTAGTKSHHCSRCTARSSVTTIPANGHSWSGWTVTKKATYEETGLKVRECTVNGCSAEESSVIAKLPLDGHTHNFGEWVTETAATCVVNGVQKRTCSICKSFETREITAIGHSFGEWVVEKTATCEAGGIQKRTCSSCKETETLSSPALGHKFGEWAVKTEATADKEGVLERKCNNCSETETQTTPKLNISVDTSSNTPSEDTSSKLDSDPKPETNPEPEADKTNGSPKGNSLTTVIIICSAIIGILLAALIVLIIIKKKK